MLLSGLPRIADPTPVKRTPILVVAAGQDQVFTVDEQKETADAYDADFELFPDQAHALMSEPRWREAADVIDRWLTEKVGLE